MRILHVISYFYPAWAYGGPPKSAYELCRELVRRGHEVTVYTTDSLSRTERLHSTPSDTCVDIEGIHVSYFRNVSNWLAGTQHLFLPPALLRTLRQRPLDFNIVHFHDARSFIHIPVFRQARRMGMPYVLQARGSAQRAGKTTLKRLYDLCWGYPMMQGSTRLLALTTVEARYYEDLGADPSRIRVVPNGINPTEFRVLPDRGNFRRRYGLEEDAKVLLYLGRIHESKGIDVLAEAYARVRQHEGKVTLAIAGPDDGYLPRLRELVAELGIGDGVLFTGPLYGDDKLAAYVDSDVHVSFRAWEPFGNTLLEALACGTPVVCSTGCGLADALRDRGALVVPYDVGKLAEALQTLLRDGDLAAALATRGKHLVHTEFTWPVIAAQVESIYRECTGQATA